MLFKRGKGWRGSYLRGTSPHDVAMSVGVEEPREGGRLEVEGKDRGLGGPQWGEQTVSLKRQGEHLTQDLPETQGQIQDTLATKPKPHTRLK